MREIEDGQEKKERRFSKDGKRPRAQLQDKEQTIHHERKKETKRRKTQTQEIRSEKQNRHHTHKRSHGQKNSSQRYKNRTIQMDEETKMIYNHT